MAHYDHRGGVGPHVRRQVESVAAAVDRRIVVSTAALTDESRAWLDERVELVERPNYGYDFTSYQVGLHRAGLAGDLTSYDEVVICNDTYVPVTPYDAIFAAMADQPVDFWGLTRTERVAPHVQSFFVAFRPCRACHNRVCGLLEDAAGCQPSFRCWLFSRRPRMAPPARQN